MCAKLLEIIGFVKVQMRGATAFLLMFRNDFTVLKPGSF